MKKAIIICPSPVSATRTFNEVLRHLSEQKLIPAGSRMSVDTHTKTLVIAGWSIRFITSRKESTLAHLNVDYTVPYHPEAEKGTEFRDAPHTTEDLMTRVLGRRYA